jgi:hypothetical protein
MDLVERKVKYLILDMRGNSYHSIKSHGLNTGHGGAFGGISSSYSLEWLIARILGFS